MLGQNEATAVCIPLWFRYGLEVTESSCAESLVSSVTVLSSGGSLGGEEWLMVSRSWEHHRWKGLV
jgi:hypothetical protein